MATIRDEGVLGYSVKLYSGDGEHLLKEFMADEIEIAGESFEGEETTVHDVTHVNYANDWETVVVQQA